MDYKSLIKTEDSDQCYLQWTDYRNSLTEYVIDSIESLYTREYLRETGKKRLVKEYGMVDIVDKIGYKPSLAIWGAGGCNDVDVCELSKHFKLVLIDHNLEKINYAKNRFNLSDDDCLCLDLKFWDISDEDYLMFEAMLKDQVPREEMASYIEDVVARMPVYNYNAMPQFDFSMAVGLVSQLNSRLAALLHINRYPHDMTKCLHNMNLQGVDSFLRAITVMTNKMMIFGYEDKVMEIGSSVAGNDIFEKRLLEMLEESKIKRFMGEELLWNFMSEKNYVMKVESYELML